MLRFLLSLSAKDSEVASLETPPRAGRDGWVELLFEAGLVAGRIDAEGHMNFFDRGLLKSVEAGATLVRIHAPERGEPGLSADGVVVPAQSGAAVKLRLGAGVALGENGDVQATRAGVVLYKAGDSLDVIDRHVQQGNVDLRTGHLAMRGSLVVRGDVERLLKVEATGDVEVLGTVSGGSLRAGGAVRVSGSVRGGEAASVFAQGDVTVRSCESAQVTACGTLRTQEAVNSRLAGAHVVVTSRLRGGSASAESSVTVKEAGTVGGATTVLEAGEPLQLPELEDVQRAVLMQKLRRMAERGGVRDAFGSRGELRGKGGKLGRVQASQSADELRQLAERAEKRRELQRTAFLEVGLAHAGVELCIGPARLTLAQAVRALRYALDAETGQLRAERTNA